jgi:hypothetical protein
MRDADLRELERRAASGDRDAMLSYVHALTRIGRSEDATAALVPRLGDPDVRRAVGSWPAWTQAEGDGGATRWAEVSPVASEPRLLWDRQRRCDPQFDRDAPVRLLASMLGIASLGGARGDSVPPTVLFDSLTGQKRAELAPATNGWIAGDVLLLQNGASVSAFDLWTGRKIHGGRIERLSCTAVGFDGSALAVRHDSGLALHAVANARERPARRWQSALPAGCNRLLVVGDTVLACSDATIALDRETGAERWRIEGAAARADARDLLVARGGGIEMVDAGTRAVRWSLRDARGLVLAPAFVVAAIGGHGWDVELAVLDRATGTRLGARKCRGLVESSVIAASDAIYLVEDQLGSTGALPAPERRGLVRRILALSTTCAPSWELALEGAVYFEPFVQLAAYPGRLVAVAQDGTLACIAGAAAKVPQPTSAEEIELERRVQELNRLDAQRQAELYARLAAERQQPSRRSTLLERLLEWLRPD